jgi:hypothetical protein
MRIYIFNHGQLLELLKNTIDHSRTFPKIPMAHEIEIIMDDHDAKNNFMDFHFPEERLLALVKEKLVEKAE